MNYPIKHLSLFPAIPLILTCNILPEKIHNIDTNIETEKTRKGNNTYEVLQNKEDVHEGARLTTELDVDSSTVIQSWVEARPVVKEKIGGRWAGGRGAKSNDTQQVLDNIWLEGHEALQELTMVGCSGTEELVIMGGLYHVLFILRVVFKAPLRIEIKLTALHFSCHVGTESLILAYNLTAYLKSAFILETIPLCEIVCTYTY